VEQIHTESEEGEPDAEEPVSSTTRSEPEEQTPGGIDVPEVKRSSRKTRKPNWITVNHAEALRADADYPITYTAAVNGGTESTHYSPQYLKTKNLFVCVARTQVCPMTSSHPEIFNHLLTLSKICQKSEESSHRTT